MHEKYATTTNTPRPEGNAALLPLSRLSPEMLKMPPELWLQATLRLHAILGHQVEAIVKENQPSRVRSAQRSYCAPRRRLALGPAFRLSDYTQPFNCIRCDSCN